MTTEEKISLLQQSQAIDDLFQNEQIDLPVYGKWSVKIARDFMLQDEFPLGVGVLCQVPDMYFGILQPQQIVDDVEYGAISKYVANQLKVRGFADSEWEVNILSRLGVC